MKKLAIIIKRIIERIDKLNWYPLTEKSKRGNRMKNYYLLWAVGPDKPGIVSEVSKLLYEKGGNLEDSSMMRLGSEFGILLIFTSTKNFTPKMFSALEKKFSLSVGLKKISPKLASFQPLKKASALVTVYGADRPGLVFEVTSLLARQRFNITDLSTHRTTKGPAAGYILLIEGEMKQSGDQKKLESTLGALGKKLDVRISVQEIETSSL
jgi:glycine cleavage system transcriptional repressor